MANEYKVKEVKKSACFEVTIEETSGSTGKNHKVTFKYDGEPKDGVASFGGAEIPIIVLDKALQAYKEQHPYDME